MFYVAIKQDWEHDEIFNRPHYYFETREDAENYLNKKDFYKDSNNDRYIFEKGYNYLIAKIVELELYVEEVESGVVEEVVETIKPEIYVKEENQYSVIASFVNDKNKIFLRMKKKIINGVVHAYYAGKLIPIDKWEYQ